MRRDETKGALRSRRAHHGGCLQGTILNKLARLMVVLLLLVMLVPTIPASQVEEAEALTGTTNYKDMFSLANRYGVPGYISGATLRAASSNDPSYFDHPGGDSSSYASSAVFLSTKEVSLLSDWTVSATLEFRGFSPHSSNQLLNMNVQPALVKEATAASLNGVGIACQRSWEKATKTTSNYLVVKDFVNSKATQRAETQKAIASNDSASFVFSYSYGSNSLTLTVGGSSLTLPNVRTTELGGRSSAYLCLMGTIQAMKVSSVSSITLNTGQSVWLTFNSMSLPHLNPAVRSITLYDANTSKEIKPTDAVRANTPVRVVCRVYNNDANSAGEQFATHFKLNSAATKNITIDTSKAVKVDNAPVSGTINSSTGVPVTLKGTNNVNNTANDSVIEYYGTINQSNGAAVVVGQVITDDMFNGSASLTKTLLNERPITPAPGNVDPANPGAGAGTSFHFARRPLANANGWNNSPVTFTFFPGALTAGGVPQLTLTKTGDALPSATLTSANRTWTRSDDTSSLPLTLQGSDPDTGVVSQTATDTLKIDTSAPTATFDATSGVLTVSDVPSDGSKATSGVWRLYRTAADGSNAQLAQPFSLTGGNGPASKAVSGLANGYYVVEDAAGNKSTPVRVTGAQPPAPSRPQPSLPGGGTDPVGPPLGDKDPVPDPEVTDADDGTTHAVTNETVTQVADPSGTLFGGSFDAADAEALMNYRYTFTTGVAGGLTQTTELLAADGSALAGGSLPTTQPGSCLVRRVVTDKQGNTTTVNLTYRLVKPAYPDVYPGGPGTDPGDPDGTGGGNPGGPGAPSNPGNPDDPNPPRTPITPDGTPTVDPDGTQHARVSMEVTEGTMAGIMGESAAKALLLRHYTPVCTDGSTPSIAVDSMERLADGATVERIDLSKPADYRIVYTLADSAGNTTTVTLIYHLVDSKIPLVVPQPDPDDPNHSGVIPAPLNPVEPPYVDEAGNHHGVVDDAMTVPVDLGAVLSEGEVRSLVLNRYAFLSATGDDVPRFVSMSIADASGKKVTFINKGFPTTYLIRYKVADAEGNTTLLRLSYNLVASNPTPKPPLDNSGGTTAGTPSVSVVDPDDPLPGRPLGPVSVQEDANGLRHAVIEDTIVVGLREGVMTPADFAALFAKRYDVASTLADGTITSSPVSLFDSEGLPVTSVDRSKPGVWQVEQVFSDSAGNTTTLRVTYDVRAEFVQTTLPAGGTRSGSSGGSLEGYGGHYTQLALAQTGDFFGPCPLHPLFALLMVLASAYGMMKLRLESFARRRLLRRARTTACDGAADGARLAGAGDASAGGTSVDSDAEELRRRMKLTDYAVFGLIGVAAVALATLALCPFDFLWASVVLLVCAAWLFLMHRKVRATNRKLAAV